MLFRTLLAMFLLSMPAMAVIPVNADGLISPARYFDLQGKTLRFTPSRQGYVIATSKAKAFGALGTKLGRPDYPSIRSRGWWFSLPFSFSYGRRTWDQVYVNSAGNLTFGRPEAQLYPERDTWPAGTMQSVAGSLNDRAAAGEERMICVFWGLNSPDDDKSRIFVRRTATEFVVTWQVQRYIWFGEGYQPLGPNVFQARLQADGVIELSYQQIAEKDGIVGLFYGGLFYGGSDGISLASAAKFSADQLGQTLRFTFQLPSPVVSTVPEGKLWYRVFLDRGQHGCEIGLEVARKPRPYLLRECYGVPGYHIDGNRLELYISAFEAESALGEGTRWKADVLWARQPGDMVDDNVGEGPLRAPLQDRLSFAPGYHEGSIFEVFHYPTVSKSVFPHLRYIYQRFAPQDDLAVVLTDFRIDDLHNHQGSTGSGYNVAIQGLGARAARISGDTRLIGSSKLQSATGPIYLGPRLAETLDDRDYHYHNYANAVGWMAHELTHRWGMDLHFRNPLNGQVESLTGGTGHWSEYLNTPAMISVWPMFSNKPYSEKSQMEGSVWTELPDGNFRRAPNPWNLPTGFSALDLYAMGLIGPDEVKDTFLVANPRNLGQNLFSGTKVPVRIADVIAACGERRPGVRDSQKEFTIGIYLLHPGNRPVDPEKLRQAEGIEKVLIDYFAAATGNRMRLIPSGSKMVNRP